MICRSCGADWSTQENYHSYYFQSETFPQGSDVSPAQIFAEGEDILFCPRCITDELYEVTRRMNDYIPGTYIPRDRLPDEEADPGDGDATVVHRPY